MTSLRPYYLPIVRWVQRRYRGWDDSDTWSLDHTMAKLMLPRLKRLRKISKGVVGPSGVFWKDMNEQSDESWAAAEAFQDRVYDDIEYFLEQLGKGEDGWDFTEEIERYVSWRVIGDDGSITETVQHPIHKRVKDERFFRGRRYLVKYIGTMGW